MRRLLFPILLFLSTVLLQALQKVVFLAWYHARAAEYDMGEILAVLVNGLKLDITVAGYITAIPILLSLLAVWLPSKGEKVLKNTLRTYIYIVSALTAMLFAGNLGLYDYWGYPLDGSVMQYLADPKHAVASVTIWEAVTYSVIAILYFCVEVWLYAYVLRTFRPIKLSLALRCGVSGALLLMVGVDFLAIRGGLTTATANVSKVYFSEHMFLNHAAVNPTFSLLSSLSSQGNEASEYHFFEEEECDKILAGLQGEGEGENLLRTQRPDVVIILAESFGCSTADAEVDGEAVAPNFQRLKREGIYFENIYCSSFRTDRGTVAALSGFPAQTKSSIMKSPAKSRNLGSIARSLRREGYNTRFVHGGDLNFTDMASYLYSTGYAHLSDLKSLDMDAPTGKWGYADDAMAQEFVKQVASTPSPMLATWLTLSSHEPFEVSEHHFEDKMLNAMWFADREIGRVVSALKEQERWANMLVIIIADHAYPYPYGVANYTAERHHIPMLWLGGTVEAPRTISTFASQTDLAATLLAQLGIESDDLPFSRNIMDKSIPHFGYYVFNNGFGVVDEQGATIYDCTRQTTISDTAAPELLNYGKAQLQATYRAIERL